MMDIWVLVPVKSLLESKRRLSHVLPAQRRAELICHLLQRELSILNQVPAVRQVLVISSDPQVWEIARQNGALVAEEQESRGLNVAVTDGLAVAVAQGASAVLILPVDLPFITVADVELLTKPWSDHSDPVLDPGMVISSDGNGQGTNALLLTTAQGFDFHFGPGSFQRHIQEAEKRGMKIEVISTSGLRFDLDNESDWYAYQAAKVSC